MSTTTQAPPGTAPQPAAVKEQANKNGAPPSRPSSPGASATGVAHRRGKLRAWLVVLTLLILGVGAGLAWAENTGTDLRAVLTGLGTKVEEGWHRLFGNDVPEGFAFIHVQFSGG